MKKTFLFFATILLIAALAFTSCNKNGKSSEACGKEIISLMKEMVNCEEYYEIYNLPSSYGDTVSQLKNGDYSNPSAVYKLSIPVSSLTQSLMQNEADLDKLPAELNDYVNSSAVVSFASRINQSAGATSLAVSSTFSAQKSFVCEEIKEASMFLYVFDNGCPIVVSFIPGESGSVRVVGQFIISDNFKTDDARQIEESCAIAGIKGVEAKKK